MEKYQRHIAIAIVTLAVADLIIGWIAGAHENFDRVYLSPLVAASIAFLIGTIGGLLHKPWVFGGGMIAVFVFCPSPAVFIPLLIGVVLLSMYAVAAQRNAQGG
ncbi:MAG: hypothetical protein IKZ87_08165 [Actinomycetaceae bacterium]|nr:hypothetical protein [Actinomycetaceae bacterium]